MVIKYLDRYRDTLYGDVEALEEVYKKIKADELVINDNKDSEETIKAIIAKLDPGDTLIIRNLGVLGNSIEQSLERAIRLLYKGVNIKILNVELDIKANDKDKLNLLRSLLKDCTYYNLDKLID